MPTKPGQKRADDAQVVRAAQRVHRSRPAASSEETAARLPLPAMQASARRCRAMRSPKAAAKRKTKRAKRARSLGGRLAAAIRLGRLRASRAAEDYFGSKR